MVRYRNCFTGRIIERPVADPWLDNSKRRWERMPTLPAPAAPPVEVFPEDEDEVLLINNDGDDSPDGKE